MARMIETDWYECKIELSNGTVLDLVHNMGDTINAAFENWLVRTKQYTAESLCAYIKKKADKFGTGHICITKAKYEEMSK